MNTRMKPGGWLGLAAGFLLAAGMLAPRAEGAPRQMQIAFAGYTNRTEVLTNFPVLVVFSNNVGGSSGFTFADFATTNGYDLRFYTNSTDTGAGLNYEIESWNTNAGKASYVWVQVPTIPTNGSGAIWAKWGDAASSQLPCTTNGATWTNGFAGVWHLKETGTNPTVKDSSANGHDSSAQVWTPTTGKIGGGGSFTAGSSQYVDINANPITTNFTISGWVKSTAVFAIFDSRYSTSAGVVLYIDSPNGKASYYSFGPNAASLVSTPSNLTDGNWHYIAASYNGTTAKIYADSSAPVSQSRAYTSISTSTKSSMAKTGFGPYYYTGSSDELRVSTVIRSDNWLWAEYQTMASNTVFNNYGAMSASGDPFPPAIQNHPVTAVTAASATFNGTLTSTGSPPADVVYVLWGENTNSWANTNAWTGGGWTNNTPFSTNITSGISADKTYYYTFAASNTTTNVVASSPVSFITGEVTVDATDPNAQFAVPTSDNGEFTFSRPLGCTNEALTVGYTMTGTATQNTHYTFSGSATFAAGDTNAVLTLEPEPGAGGTAILTLTAGAYPIGTASNDTVTIAAFAGKVWTGASSTDWNTPGNWTGGLPGETDDVLIDGAPYGNHPTLNLSGGAVTIKSLSLGLTGASTLTFSNGDVTDKKLIVTGNATIGANGTLTHAPETATGSNPENHRLFLDVAGNVTIASGGAIDVSGKGYAAQQGPGAGSARNGGGHGGEGGLGYLSSVHSKTYGSITNPVNSGSGSAGLIGGGVILIEVAGDMAVNGTITANGQGFTGTAVNGGGAGGSIHIAARTIMGAGTISSDGGRVFDSTGNRQRGGGGGGRIAVILTGSGATFADYELSQITAYGGSGEEQSGAAGTVYLKTLDQDYGGLIVNNSNLVTGAMTIFTNATYRFDSILTTNAGVLVTGAGATLDLTGCVLKSDSTTNSLVSRLVFGPHSNAIVWPSAYTNTGTLSQRGTNQFAIPDDLTIASGGILSHEVNTATDTNRVNIAIAGSLTVASGGAISVAGRGNDSFGLGGGTGRAGGTHGGLGGLGYLSTTLGTTYGSVTNPVLVGSGSGGTLRGGGVILIEVTGGMAVNGTIAANGQGFTGSGVVGGGAGGSINIATRTIMGAGTISSDGGRVFDSTNRGRGGGGGGRIAVILTGSGATFADYELSQITAYGGSGESGYESGAAGTLYLQTAAQGAGRGTATINNNAQTTGARTQLPPAVSPVLDELRYASVIVTNRGALAVTTNDRIASLTVATANEPLNLGVAGTVLTLNTMTINNATYTKGGLYTTNNWNGFTKPSNVTGAGAIEIHSKGTVIMIR